MRNISIKGKAARVGVEALGAVVRLSGSTPRARSVEPLSPEALITQRPIRRPTTAVSPRAGLKPRQNLLQNSAQEGVPTRKCSECTTSGTDEERRTAVPSELQAIWHRRKLLIYMSFKQLRADGVQLGQRAPLHRKSAPLRPDASSLRSAIHATACPSESAKQPLKTVSHESVWQF